MRICFWRLRTVRAMARRPLSAISRVATPRAFSVSGGIEIEHLGEILRIKIFIRFQPAAAHQHIRRTVLQQTAIENLQIQLVQFFQKAVVPAILQIIKIVRHIVRRSVFYGGYYGFLPNVPLSSSAPNRFSNASITSGSCSVGTCQSGTGRDKRLSWVSDISK